ncbi:MULTISPECIES: amidophosphoribosyltransferase [unclassified Thermosipho (in: thermotogales)]|uniref:amidophosphoribosyltransferase n=1 Tax=unclassified Thermosipho (in: thermotogales) TaxID=2676525 RepID=UPI000985FB02|nr:MULTISPECIES: amidophosphoribosyltransferase [unclassified Thermosipho (in: thermotogales)]MBT1247132.1 amidophosphoribosyltransferase [Thermosipho sp. 1244]OOC47115.1 amidophosphoribosyltransferase [Thermosipho sp. 1223]
MCGIAGVWNVDDSYNILHDILLGLQHRGQESTGIVIEGFKFLKMQGLVSQVLTKENYINGRSGIGHVRYSTFGENSEIQPLMGLTSKGKFAIAHNGNIPDAKIRMKSLVEKGAVFNTTIDSEVFLHYISLAPYSDPKLSTQWSLSRIPGAYSIVILTDNMLIAARDSYGFRPLFYGKFKGGFVVSSEDSALTALGAKEITEIVPGEMVIFSDMGLEKVKFATTKMRFCAFEYIYFSRPDSNFYYGNVHRARFKMGEILYRESQMTGDIVIPILDSGFSGALGFSLASKIPIELGLMRNRYLGRSFIMPENREEIVKRKLIPIPQVIKNKEVIVIDDSIVRGTTMKQIVKMLRESGAKKVKIGIHSPPVIGPCPYGIDTSRKSELIANQKEIEEIIKEINADELYYLSLNGLKEAIGGDKLCLGCLNLNYLI